ncbi:MAG: hypothetical protein QOG80_3070, partial [Pseudonocardiales bacterium]|nr:hypothetical protein [Pseudonocardiales bacterium]
PLSVVVREPKVPQLLLSGLDLMRMRWSSRRHVAMMTSLYPDTHPMPQHKHGGIASDHAA